jgi:hypothetical protein
MSIERQLQHTACIQPAYRLKGQNLHVNVILKYGKTLIRLAGLISSLSLLGYPQNRPRLRYPNQPQHHRYYPNPSQDRHLPHRHRCQHRQWLTQQHLSQLGVHIQWYIVIRNVIPSEM